MPVRTRLAVEVARAGILGWSALRIELAVQSAEANALNRKLWIPFCGSTKGR